MFRGLNLSIGVEVFGSSNWQAACSAIYFIHSSIAPFGDDAPAVRGRYGVIEVIDRRLAAIHLRRWPRVASALEAGWLGRRRHQQSCLATAVGCITISRGGIPTTWR